MPLNSAFNGIDGIKSPNIHVIRKHTRGKTTDRQDKTRGERRRFLKILKIHILLFFLNFFSFFFSAFGLNGSERFAKRARVHGFRHALRKHRTVHSARGRRLTNDTVYRRSREAVDTRRGRTSGRTS